MGHTAAGGEPARPPRRYPATSIETYLKKEVTAEALVRKRDPFVWVFQVAGLYNGQILNLENLSRESEVKRSTVERYFQILEDTLLACPR